MNSTTQPARRSGSLETLGIPKKHLGNHANQQVTSEKFNLYPQKYPFLQWFRADDSGRTEGRC